jgi:hypothetical protein
MLNVDDVRFIIVGTGSEPIVAESGPHINKYSTVHVKIGDRWVDIFNEADQSSHMRQVIDYIKTSTSPTAVCTRMAVPNARLAAGMATHIQGFLTPLRQGNDSVIPNLLTPTIEAMLNSALMFSVATYRTLNNLYSLTFGEATIKVLRALAIVMSRKAYEDVQLLTNYGI